MEHRFALPDCGTGDVSAAQSIQVSRRLADVSRAIRRHKLPHSSGEEVITK